MGKIVYLSLGSNLGNRADSLKKAIQLLNDSDQVEIIKESQIYETNHWNELKNKSNGKILNQVQDDRWDDTIPNYLNQVIQIKTSLNPFELLKVTQQIERDLGRESKGDLAPRTIDIDILLYGDEVVNSDDLTIPHPRMTGRKFVLVPLAEMNPELKNPQSGELFMDILQKCGDNTKIRLYEPMTNSQ